MFAGESEIQARRRTLAVLIDEMRRVTDAARDMGVAYASVLGRDATAVLAALERARKAEEDVEALRRTLARELAEIGTLVLNREDLLRAAYNIEDLAGYIIGIIFRLTQVKKKALAKNGLDKDLRELVELMAESVHRLGETVRSLTLSPNQTLELANGVQKLEKVIDDKYRTSTMKLTASAANFKDFVTIKDVLDIIEEAGDKCLEAADCVTILALGL